MDMKQMHAVVKTACLLIDSRENESEKLTKKASVLAAGGAGLLGGAGVMAALLAKGKIFGKKNLMQHPAIKKFLLDNASGKWGGKNLAERSEALKKAYEQAIKTSNPSKFRPWKNFETTAKDTKDITSLAERFAADEQLVSQALPKNVDWNDVAVKMLEYAKKNPLKATGLGMGATAVAGRGVDLMGRAMGTNKKNGPTISF